MVSRGLRVVRRTTEGKYDISKPPVIDDERLDSRFRTGGRIPTV